MPITRKSSRVDVVLPAKLVLLASIQSSDQTSLDRYGAHVLDLSQYPAVIGKLSRKIRFKSVLENSLHNTGYNAFAQLFDITHSVIITGSDLDNTGAVDRSIATEYSSGLLTVGASAGNIRSDVTTLYAVHFAAEGTLTPPNDRAIIEHARIEITYE